MGDVRNYPEGRGALKGRYVGGVLTFYNTDGTVLYYVDPVNKRAMFPGHVKCERFHVAIATINGGATSLVAALPGYAFRMVDVTAVSVGGAAGAVTTVDVLGTLATVSSKLAAFAQASLTQSTVLKPGVAGTTVLADGASFQQLDVNTPIQISKTGASITTATFIDILLSYVTVPV